MSLAIDLRNAIYSLPSGTNFTVNLLRLFFKADRQNFLRLSIVFPIEARVVEIYKTGKYNTDTIDSWEKIVEEARETVEIPDEHSLLFLLGNL